MFHVTFGDKAKVWGTIAHVPNEELSHLVRVGGVKKVGLHISWDPVKKVLRVIYGDQITGIPYFDTLFWLIWNP